MYIQKQNAERQIEIQGSAISGGGHDAAPAKKGKGTDKGKGKGDSAAGRGKGKGGLKGKTSNATPAPKAKAQPRPKSVPKKPTATRQKTPPPPPAAPAAGQGRTRWAAGNPHGKCFAHSLGLCKKVCPSGYDHTAQLTKSEVQFRDKCIAEYKRDGLTLPWERDATPSAPAQPKAKAKPKGKAKAKAGASDKSNIPCRNVKVGGPVSDCKFGSQCQFSHAHGKQ